MTPVFELKNLQVTLRQHRHATELVKGVSFAVEPGECLGILGESGSGKSMSMKAAMGLLDKGFSVSGAAMFQGEPLLEKIEEELRRLRGGKVGVVLQNPMTCFDPLYRIGTQIAETFAAHNNSTREMAFKSWEINTMAVCFSCLTRKNSFSISYWVMASIARRYWRSILTSSPAECSSGS